MTINYEVSRDGSSLIHVAFYDAAYSDTNALVWFGDETNDGRDCVYFPSTIKAEHFPALRNILRVFFGDTAANRMTAEAAEIRAAYERRFPGYYGAHCIAPTDFEVRKFWTRFAALEREAG